MKKHFSKVAVLLMVLVAVLMLVGCAVEINMKDMLKGGEDAKETKEQDNIPLGSLDVSLEEFVDDFNFLASIGKEEVKVKLENVRAGEKEGIYLGDIVNESGQKAKAFIAVNSDGMLKRVSIVGEFEEKEVFSTAISVLGTLIEGLECGEILEELREQIKQGKDIAELVRGDLKYHFAWWPKLAFEVLRNE